MARSDYSEAGSGQWWWFTNRDYILIINWILQADRVNYLLIWGGASIENLNCNSRVHGRLNLAVS